MTIPTNIKSVLKDLPRKPGVYRYYGLDGSLLYIGKAKNLKNRVSSYFQKNGLYNQRISIMISQIDHIEYTVVESEEESLILESNLINSLQPKYNIRLKDDSSYCYIQLKKGEIPGFFVVRQKLDPQSVYFGPYSSRFAVEETLRTLRSIFPFCQAQKKQKQLCSYVGIGQCEGICVGKEALDSYLEKVDQIRNILSGKLEVVEYYILSKIKEAVDDENFVIATLWKERLNILKRILQSKKISLKNTQDLDLITLIIDNDLEGFQMGSIFVQQIREGRVINISNFLLSGSEFLEENSVRDNNLENLAGRFLSRFLVSHYSYQINKVSIFIQIFKSSQI